MRAHSLFLFSDFHSYRSTTMMTLLTNVLTAWFATEWVVTASPRAVSPAALTRHTRPAPLWIPPLRQPDSPHFSLREFDKSLRMQAESLTHFLISEYCKRAQRLCVQNKASRPVLTATPTIPTVFCLRTHTHTHTHTHANMPTHADNGAFVSSLTHSPTVIGPPFSVRWSVQIASECLFECNWPLVFPHWRLFIGTSQLSSCHNRDPNLLDPHTLRSLILVMCMFVSGIRASAERGRVTIDTREIWICSDIDQVERSQGEHSVWEGSGVSGEQRRSPPPRSLHPPSEWLLLHPLSLLWIVVNNVSSSACLFRFKHQIQPQS